MYEGLLNYAYRPDLDFDVMDGSIVDIRLAVGVRVLNDSVTEDDAFCRQALYESDHIGRDMPFFQCDDSLDLLIPLSEDDECEFRACCTG